MTHSLARIGGVVGLTVLTLTVSLIVPGFVGAFTPVPLSFDNAIGIYTLSAAFLLFCLGLYLLRELAHPRVDWE